MITMMNTRIGMTTMTRLLYTWDVEGMSAELYTLMQIAAALLRIDNDRGDEEQKTVTYILMELRNMRLIFILSLSYHFSCFRAKDFGRNPQVCRFPFSKEIVCRKEGGGPLEKSGKEFLTFRKHIFSVSESTY